MTHRSRVLVYLAAALACGSGSGWAQADPLKHDPFARPALRKATPPPLALQRDGGGGIAASLERAWKPELAAVMVAGSKSAVSIDGTMVRIGELIDGHRLVEVHEQTATFVKNRKRVTLTLRAMEATGAPAARKDESTPAQPASGKADERDTEARAERNPR